jgi:hypothetical protein
MTSWQTAGNLRSLSLVMFLLFGFPCSVEGEDWSRVPVTIVSQYEYAGGKLNMLWARATTDKIDRKARANR